ncbi:MAG: hypothetical protein ABG776_04525 [Cyanobacteria bacterium J06555_13]
MALHMDFKKPDENVSSRPPSSLAAVQSEENPGIQVGLSINFRGHQPIAIPAGKELGLPNGEVDFGFQRGQLQLFLENCKMPRISGFLSQGTGRSVAVEKPDLEQEQICLSQSSRGSVVGTLPREILSSEDAELQGKLEEIYMERQGSEDSPIWFFRTQGKQKILKGKLTTMVLGTLPYLSGPYRLTARFTVRREDIRLSWGKAVATELIPRNKLAVIQSILTHEYIGPKIDACPLCEVSWSHE